MVSLNDGGWERIDACWWVYNDQDHSTDEGYANYNHTQAIIIIIIITSWDCYFIIYVGIIFKTINCYYKYMKQWQGW